MVTASETTSALDLVAVRAAFPILAQTLHGGKPLVYFDNAASTQKPRAVIDAIAGYYRRDHANVHRAVHVLSQRATAAYEGACETVRAFINAAEGAEVLFTRGTTESINLVASCVGRDRLRAGDEILLTQLEHHSNIVPWQMAAQAVGARVVAVPVSDAGEVSLEAFAERLSPRTKVVSVSWVSNALGTINPVEEMIGLVRRRAPDALVMIDAAQWVAHGPTDVRALGCDVLAFSGHKLYGPTGIGVLYGRRELLESLPPWQGGGDMIETVSFDGTTYAGLPNKFEAGTPNIAGAVGLAAAIEYVREIGFEAIAAHEHELLERATARLAAVPGLKIYGTAARKSGVVGFLIDGVSALDVGVRLDQEGIAVRTGHHCCMPLMKRFGIEGTVRTSFAMYNTPDEVDRLADVLGQIVRGRTSVGPTAQPANASDGGLEFPAAVAESPSAAADALAEDFALFDDATGKNQYVLDLAASLPATFGTLKPLTQRLAGCMSEVYFIGRSAPRDPARIEFLADANADIVRGLIAVMQRLFAGQRASEVLGFDVEAFFRRIGLDQFITTQRRNGLSSLVGRIRQLAAEVANSKGAKS